MLSDNADVSRIFKSAVCKGLPFVAAHKLILAAAEINTRRISTATEGGGYRHEICINACNAVFSAQGYFTIIATIVLHYS